MSSISKFCIIPTKISYPGVDSITSVKTRVGLIGSPRCVCKRFPWFPSKFPLYRIKMFDYDKIKKKGVQNWQLSHHALDQGQYSYSCPWLDLWMFSKVCSNLNKCRLKIYRTSHRYRWLIRYVANFIKLNCILFVTSNHQTTNIIFPNFFHKFF